MHDFFDFNGDGSVSFDEELFGHMILEEGIAEEEREERRRARESEAAGGEDNEDDEA